MLEKFIPATPVIRSSHFLRDYTVVGMTCDVDSLVLGCTQKLRSWYHFEFHRDKVAHTQSYLKSEDFQTNA